MIPKRARRFPESVSYSINFPAQNYVPLIILRVSWPIRVIRHRFPVYTTLLTFTLKRKRAAVCLPSFGEGRKIIHDPLAEIPFVGREIERRVERFTKDILDLFAVHDSHPFAPRVGARPLDNIIYLMYIVWRI